MKERKYFLVALFTLTLLMCSSTLGLAENFKSISKSGGEMESYASGGTDGSSTVPKGFQRAFNGGNRNFKWVTDGRSAVGASDKSSRGALDGTTYSSKDNTFRTTVLADTIKVGQQLIGSEYHVYKGFLSFDTSALDDPNSIISSAKLVIYRKGKNITNSSDDFRIDVYKSVYVEPLWNSDWDAVLSKAGRSDYVNGLSYPNPGTPIQNVALEVSSDPNVYRCIIDLSSSVIVRGGVTKLALLSSNTSAETTPSANEFVEIYSPNAPVALRPSLVLEYGGTPHPKPALSWLMGDAYYKDTGAQPDNLYEGTTKVTFRVRYYSGETDGSTPSTPSLAKVWIDKDGNGIADEVEMYSMTLDPNDTDYTDGRDYQATVDVVSTGSDVRYQFLFKDQNGNPAGGGTPASVRVLTAIQSSKDSDSDSGKVCFISSLRGW
ncbi:MAG: hypothetical protein AB1847_00300 [bacterium]